jgi:hypothetical protein
LDAGKDSAIATDGGEMIVDVDVDSNGIVIGIGFGNGDRKMVDEGEDAMDRELPLFHCHPCFHSFHSLSNIHFPRQFPHV